MLNGVTNVVVAVTNVGVTNVVAVTNVAVFDVILLNCCCTDVASLYHCITEFPVADDKKTFKQ